MPPNTTARRRQHSHPGARPHGRRRTPAVWLALCALAALPLIGVEADAQQPGAARAPAKLAKAAPAKRKSSGQSIVALVNDEPITGYEVEQRMKLALLSAPELQRRLQSRLKSKKINEEFKAFAIKRLKGNPPKSEAEQQARVKQLQKQFVRSIQRKVEAEYRPKARKVALDELIAERLKLQEAKRLNVVATKDAVDRIVKGMAERNKMTIKQFGEHMAKMGGDISTIRQRVKASLSWSDVIRRRFGHQISQLAGSVEHVVASVEGASDVELKVHRILLSLPSDNGQKQVAQRLSDAERLRAQYAGCATMNALASRVGGARYDDLGERKPASIPEPTRSLLMSARDGEMLPPVIGDAGVELWAICGRQVVENKDKNNKRKKQSAKSDERQKEFEILSKKHLKDLRQDAHIEYR